MSEQSQHLLNLALAGNLSGIGRLLCMHSQYLRALAQSQLDHRLKHRISPSDLVQETLLEAHRDFGKFRGTTTAELVGWLRRILIHNLITVSEQHLRTEKRDVRREVSLEKLQTSDGRKSKFKIALPAATPSPSAAMQGKERSTQLDQAMKMLSAEQQQVVYMRHIEGLPFSEIAMRLNRTCGACRMIWLRAVEQLRQSLQESAS